VDSTIFRSSIENLRYLTCTKPDIFYGVGLVCRHMEAPTITHFKAAKRILRYAKCTINFGLLYPSSNEFTNLWVIVIVIGVEMWMIEIKEHHWICFLFGKFGIYLEF